MLHGKNKCNFAYYFIIIHDNIRKQNLYLPIKAIESAMLVYTKVKDHIVVINIL